MRRLCSALLTVALLAGCSGGGGTSSSVVPQTHPSGTPSSSPIKPADATATVSIVLPVRTPSSTGRSTRFISPAAGSITISVYSVDGVVQSGAQTQVVPLASGGPSCSSVGGATTCTASIAIPSGSDVFSVASYTSTNGTGTPLGTGLSVPQTIYANSANRVTLALNGIIANLYVFPGVSHFVPGTPATGLIFVIPLDPSGNPIVNPGAYASPIALQSGDPRVKLDLNGGAQVSTVSIASPNDVITMHYDGTGSIGVASFNATTAATPPSVPTAPTGGFGISIVTTFVPITVGAPSGPFANGAAYLFDALAGNETATISIATGGPAQLVTAASPFVASVSPSSGPGPFTVTRVGPGSTYITVMNASGASATLPVSVGENTGVLAIPAAQVISAVSGNTINIGNGGVASIAVVGGTSIYTPNNTCSPANITLTGSNSQYSIHDISSTPFSCTLAFTDPGGAFLTPLTTQTLTINGYSAPTLSPNVMNFTTPGSGSSQSRTVIGGLPPYTIKSSPTSSFTTSIVGSTISAYWNGGSGPNTVYFVDSAAQVFFIVLGTPVPNAFGDTLAAELYASTAGNVINLLNNPAAGAFLAISGGTGTYTVTPSCPASIVTLTSQPGGYQVNSGGTAGACSITINDGVNSLTAVTVNVLAYPLPSTGTLTFTSGLGVAAQQTVTIGGGIAPFTIASSPAFLTSNIVGNTLSVYPNSAGSGTIVVHDSLGGTVLVNATATTVTIPILSRP